MATKIVIFDTSIFIDHLRTNQYSNNFLDLQGLIRNSSVVLSELSRGATKEAETAFVAALARNHPILTPTTKNWLESGKILSKINRDKGFSPIKLRDLHFDVLIALTARNYGATVITSNKTDFDLIRYYRDFHLEVW
ncbi:MAG: type II toxin-antitoxin system VapC family toxin [Dissulfurispiraceae bacterium]|jgi:predicted nucleic acid-binding protein